MEVAMEDGGAERGAEELSTEPRQRVQQSMRRTQARQHDGAPGTAGLLQSLLELKDGLTRGLDELLLLVPRRAALCVGAGVFVQPGHLREQVLARCGVAP